MRLRKEAKFPPGPNFRGVGPRVLLSWRPTLWGAGSPDFRRVGFHPLQRLGLDTLRWRPGMVWWGLPSANGPEKGGSLAATAWYCYDNLLPFPSRPPAPAMMLGSLSTCREFGGGWPVSTSAPEATLLSALSLVTPNLHGFATLLSSHNNSTKEHCLCNLIPLRPLLVPFACLSGVY